MIRESVRTVQFIVFLGSCLALSNLLADFAFAQDEFEAEDAAPKTELGIAQASEDDVRGRFGPPDGIQAESEGATWRYGRSAIFFSHGTVSGWTDQGELQKRAFAASLRQQKREVDPLSAGMPKKGWRNDWEKAEGVAPEDVIDGLMKSDH